MTIFDYVVVGVLVVSVLLGMFRGIVREVLSLAGWVVAFLAVKWLAPDLELLLPPGIREPLRMPVAYGAVFLLSLAGMGLVIMLVSAVVKTVGLGWADRVLGMLFGLGRGLLVMILLVLAAGMTAIPEEAFWQQALLTKPLERMAVSVMPWLPEAISGQIHFGRQTEAKVRRSG